MRKFVGYIGVALLIGIFILGFLAYFVAGNNYDGLGRKLYEAPYLATFFLGASPRWPGLYWFIADFIIFWGSIFLSWSLMDWAFEKSSST